ncbi:Polycomb protein suz12-B [Pseudolycoriella hygida]|uniref:Polycomb protein suz12-B n=1 Tax=Pseudolycoriella hygida TaxID=35572 RepID=A0A9Q0N0N9_9DIPT|nr:Polycomb protein suz12-B [Pseudolycoriella hygida]
MPERMSRTKKNRSSFKVGNILSTKEDQMKNESTDKALGKGFTITFTGFFDESPPKVKVKVETLFSEVSHKKRKCITKTSQILVGRSVLVVNSDDPPSADNTSEVYVSFDNLSIPEQGWYRSYRLQFNVKTFKDAIKPCPKRFKFQNNVYEADLLIIDKQKQRVLLDGKYELFLVEKQSPVAGSNSKKTKNALVELRKSARLKFQLAWTTKNDTNQRQTGNKFMKSPGIIEKEKIFYELVYNYNLRQQLKASAGFNCIFCSLNCMTLYSLFQHQQLFHEKFSFNCVPSSQVDYRIEVRISDSYIKSAQDTFKSSLHPFFKFSPLRKRAGTELLVFRRSQKRSSIEHRGRGLPLERKNGMVTDELTDVNEGAKEMMKMRNAHLMNERCADNENLLELRNAIVKEDEFRKMKQQHEEQENMRSYDDESNKAAVVFKKSKDINVNSHEISEENGRKSVKISQRRQTMKPKIPEENRRRSLRIYRRMHRRQFPHPLSSV